MRMFSASKAEPLVDTLLGKINGPLLKRTFKSITGRDIPAGIAEGIRDNQGPYVGTLSSELSLILGLGSTKGEDTLWGKAKGIFYRAAYPVSKIFKGSQSELVEDSILGTVNAGINVLGSIKIPGTGVKLGGLSLMPGGINYEPTMTSKMKLATAGVGLGSLATVGADIAMSGAPGELSAWAAGIYGVMAASRDSGGQYLLGAGADVGSLLLHGGFLDSTFADIKSIPRDLVHSYKHEGGRESIVRSIGELGDAVISAPGKAGRMVKKIANISEEEALEALRHAKDKANKVLSIAETALTPVTAGIDYLAGGNQKVLHSEIKRLMKRNPDLGITIGRGSTDFLSEAQRLDLARREIEILRRRGPPIG
jgi:hypothetical protein